LDESSPLTPEVIQQLLKMARAQEDANRIEQSKLNVERRKETATLEILSSSQHLSQDVRQLIFEVRQLLDYFRAYALKEDAIRDMFESIAERMERMERNDILLLTENNPQKRVEAAEELEQELTIKRQLKRRQRNLNKLLEQAAEYGELDVPLKVRNAIEAEQEKIADLESQLK
jgi:hypothetical protein